MRKPTKFLTLTDAERATLEAHWRENPTFRVRQRAHALLLSCRGYTVDSIAEIFQVNRDTVARWIDSWIDQGEAGLFDELRSGAPPTLTPQEQDRAIELLKENPHQPARVRALIEKETGKSVSEQILRRIARDAGLTWKRMRRSCKSRRDEDAFREAQQDLIEMTQWHEQGEVNLYYFDEAGFSTVPCIPYGWQEVGHTQEVNSENSKRLNVLGFLGAGDEFEVFTRVGKVDTGVVSMCIDAFSENLSRPTVLVLDNAPMHTSKELESNLQKWSDRGLELYYLPAYSPELNRIEMLWRNIKYHWLPLAAYESFNTLVECVSQTLCQIGDTLFMNTQPATS